jgi:1-acyl-sn-glycerol-3-phosphate acyltransferase
MRERRRVLSLRVLIHLLLLRPLLRLIFGINVTGRENLKGLDRFILVANHNSHLDTLLLYSVLPVGQIPTTHPLAARDYFARHRWLFAVVNYLFRPIWIDRIQKEGDPIAETLRVIDRGCSVIVFPEGTRGEPGQIQEFKTGVGRLVERRRDVPVVPVFLLGPERSLPKRAPFPLPLWNRGPAPTAPGGERGCHSLAADVDRKPGALGIGPAPQTTTFEEVLLHDRRAGDRRVR